MNAERRKAWQSARKGIRYRLPAAVRRALREKLLAAESLTTELAAALDDEFGLREKYGAAEPWHFLMREREAAAEDQFLTRLKEYRRRQVRAGKFLKKSMGKESESNRRLWEDNTYLTLVEKIFVRLMQDQSEMPTEELTALSKALAEHRRVSAREPGATGKSSSVDPKGDAKIPENFAETVRQLYGANFQNPNANNEVETQKNCPEPRASARAEPRNIGNHSQ